MASGTAIALGFILTGAAAWGQQSKPLAKPGLEPAPTIASVMDRRLTIVESEFLPAAAAMPEDKYSFVPTTGNYTGVRTFAQQVEHVAATNFAFYSAILGQAPPPGVTLVGATNGPDDIQTKEQILKYLRESSRWGTRRWRR